MKPDLAISVSLIGILAIYAFGFFFWPYMPKETPVLNNLYYVSIASTIYGLSMALFITAKSKLLKIVTCLWVSVSSVALYKEIFLDPTNWTWWSVGLLIFVSLNLFLIVSIVEKIKSKNGSSNNDN